MSPMKTLCVALLYFASQVVAQKADCSAERLEQCTRNLLQYTKDDVPVPENEQQVLDNCDIIRNGSQCVRSYFMKCSPSMVRQMTKVVMAGVTRTINKNCSPNGVKELLKHRDCINDVKLEIRSCYTELVRDVYRIKESPRENLHPLTCCFVSKFQKCTTDAIVKTCREESREYYIQESTKLMNELLELFCPESYRWGMSDCAAVATGLPEPNMPEDGKTPTILPLVIDMMKQFTDA
ncbi:hypothetical protein HDE_11727 [Halotydeus destructor]|nr:hypothetical protein HDE_11727 [Halotydeus destructor]